MRRALGIALSLPLGLALASCGGSVTMPPRSGDRAIAPLAEVTAKLAVKRFAGKPAMAAIARDGDPTVAMAAVLLVDDAASGAAPGLAAVLEERMRARSAEARVARGAIIITWEGSSAASGALGAFSTALTEAIAPTSSLAERAAELAGPVVPRGLEAAARCSGAPLTGDNAAAADVTTTAGAATIEALRRTVATSERVSLAVVGDSSAVARAADELARSAAWPAGAPVQREVVKGGVTSVIQADGPAAAAGREAATHLILGIDVAAAARAPSIARALADAADPLAMQLALLAPRFAIVGASGVAHAGGSGSCLRLDLRARRAEALDAEAVGLAARIVRDAAARTSSGDDAAAARSIVTAGDARESAARAAWWTTTADTEGVASAPIFAALSQGGERAMRITVEDATRAIDRASGAPARTSIERRVRHEPGQGAFVMAVGSPCPASLDARTLDDTAALALGLVAAARERPDADVELIPFVGADGAGLVARSEPRPGESGAALSVRVARALGAALGGRRPAIAEIERTRARLVEGAARDWGHPEASEALLRGVAPEQPLALAPFGLETALVRAEAAAAAGMPTDVLAGALRAAVLSNVDDTQADRAIAELASRLPPSAPAACPARPAAPTPARGRVDVRVAGDERFAQLAWATGPLSEEAAEVAVSILQLDDGEVARAAATVGASMRARRAGTEVLLDIRVAPERTEDAFIAISGALDGVARDELTEPARSRVTASARSHLRLRSADPTARVVELWRKGAIFDATPPDPRSIAPRLGAASWFVVVARPS